MEIQTLSLISGARRARGLTVIIDVFRAFTLECYMAAGGAAAIHPVGAVEEAFALRRAHPDWLLAGERGGAKVPGFDYGNSPWEIHRVDLTGRTVLHTTSAGTQGIVNAGAETGGVTEIITGSLVNADAVISYIKEQDPAVVSLVCMGNAGTRYAEEDALCADYIRASLLGEAMDIRARADALRYTAGAKFFDPDNAIFPEGDFGLCVDVGRFDFVQRIETGADGLFTSVPVQVGKKDS